MRLHSHIDTRFCRYQTYITLFATLVLMIGIFTILILSGIVYPLYMTILALILLGIQYYAVSQTLRIKKSIYPDLYFEFTEHSLNFLEINLLGERKERSIPYSNIKHCLIRRTLAHMLYGQDMGNLFILYQKESSRVLQVVRIYDLLEVSLKTEQAKAISQTD